MLAKQKVTGELFALKVLKKEVIVAKVNSFIMIIDDILHCIVLKSVYMYYLQCTITSYMYYSHVQVNDFSPCNRTSWFPENYA